MLLVLLAGIIAAAPAAALEGVASIRPVHGIVAAVMGDVGRPRLLISGESDPHHHALRPSEARALARADAVFVVSLAMEGYMRRAAASLGLGEKLVELARADGVRRLPRRRLDPPGIPARPVRGTDWHVWTDADNVIAMARAVAARLARLDPARGDTFRANAAALERRLRARAERTAARLRPLAGRPFLLVHDATQYFERRHGLRPLAAVQPDDETAPGPRRLAAVLALARAHPGICVLTPPGGGERWARMLAREAGARPVRVDVLGLGLEPGRDFWSRLPEVLTQAYVRCLGG